MLMYMQRWSVAFEQLIMAENLVDRAKQERERAEDGAAAAFSQLSVCYRHEQEAKDHLAERQAAVRVIAAEGGRLMVRGVIRRVGSNKDDDKGKGVGKGKNDGGKDKGKGKEEVTRITVDTTTESEEASGSGLSRRNTV